MDDVDYSWRFPEHAARRLEAVQQQLETLPWCQGQLTHLESDPDVVVSTAVTNISASPELRFRQLGSLLPGLEGLPQTPSFAPYVGTRGMRVLQAHAGDEWSDLARLSAAELITWPECGEKTVAEILFCTIDFWVAGTWRSSDRFPQQRAARLAPSRINSESSRHRRNSVEARIALDAIGKAAYRAGATNVSEAIGLLIDGSLVASDESLAVRWKGFCSYRLDAVFGLRLDRAWDVLLEFDERALRILEAHAPTHPDRSTHASLGQELGISTGRVGQIEQRCRRMIVDRLRTDACAPIAHHASRLRRELGTLVPAAVLDARLEPLLPYEASHPLLCRDILLEQAGPYRLAEGCWQASSP